MTDTNARPASENFGTEKTQRSNSIALDEDPENQDLDPTKRFPPFEEDPYLVFLDEEESPRNYSLLRKCVVVFVVSTGALCSTFASSIVRPSNKLTLLGTQTFRPGSIRRDGRRTDVSRKQRSRHIECQPLCPRNW